MCVCIYICERERKKKGQRKTKVKELVVGVGGLNEEGKMKLVLITTPSFCSRKEEEEEGRKQYEMAVVERKARVFFLFVSAISFDLIIIFRVFWGGLLFFIHPSIHPSIVGWFPFCLSYYVWVAARLLLSLATDNPSWALVQS